MPSPAAPSTSPNAELRVGVIGLGFAGTTALDAFASLPRVSVVALAGQESARLQELGESRGVPSLYHDWEDLVARDDLDIVSIGVPNNLHHPIALAALSSGKHVFCEKPLAPTGALAQEMVDAALEHNRVLEIAFNHRRRADVRFLHDYLTEHDFGRIYHAGQLAPPGRHPRDRVLVHQQDDGGRRPDDRPGPARARHRAAPAR